MVLRSACYLPNNATVSAIIHLLDGWVGRVDMGPLVRARFKNVIDYLRAILQNLNLV